MFPIAKRLTILVLMKGILEERRRIGTYEEDAADFIDIFLREIDAHKNDPPETNLFTGKNSCSQLFTLSISLDFFQLKF